MANKASEQSTGWNSDARVRSWVETWLGLIFWVLLEECGWAKSYHTRPCVWSRDELQWQGYGEEHPPRAISQGLCDMETWRKNRAGPGKCWVSECTRVTCTHTPCWLPDENVILMDDKKTHKRPTVHLQKKSQFENSSRRYCSDETLYFINLSAKASEGKVKSYWQNVNGGGCYVITGNVWFTNSFL